MSDNYNQQSWNNDQTGPLGQGNPQSGPVPNPGYQQPYQQPYGAAAPTEPVVQGSDPAGFFKALFDFSFSHFVTPKVVKFIYILATVMIALTWFFLLIAAASNGGGLSILIVLLLGPIAAILYLTFIRMTLEFYLATVRMSEDIHHRLR